MLRQRVAQLTCAFLMLPALAVAKPAFTGENPLGVPRAEFKAAQEGMDLIYQRQYAAALELFEETGVDFPDSPLGPVGRSVVWQALMYENRDFAHERAWLTEKAEADAIITRSRRQSDRKAWTSFLEGVHLGMAALYDIRRGDNLPAFNKAWEALERMKQVERLAPEFHDVQLALGMYNYWRTAMSEKIDGLPSFGDHRAEGMAQMKLARDQGLLAPAPASLVITYSLLEGGDTRGALAEAASVAADYPENVITLMILGRLQRKARRHDDSLATFRQATEAAPENRIVWYELGRALARDRKNYTEAMAAFDRFIEVAPTDGYKADGWYRKGLLERKARRYTPAITAFERALALDPKLTRASERIAQVQAQQERAEASRARRRTKRGDGKVRPRTGVTKQQLKQRKTQENAAAE